MGLEEAAEGEKLTQPALPGVAQEAWNMGGERDRDRAFLGFVCGHVAENTPLHACTCLRPTIYKSGAHVCILGDGYMPATPRASLPDMCSGGITWVVNEVPHTSQNGSFPTVFFGVSHPHG